MKIILIFCVDKIDYHDIIQLLIIIVYLKIMGNIIKDMLILIKFIFRIIKKLL